MEHTTLTKTTQAEHDLRTEREDFHRGSLSSSRGGFENTQTCSGACVGLSPHPLRPPGGPTPSYDNQCGVSKACSCGSITDLMIGGGGLIKGVINQGPANRRRVIRMVRYQVRSYQRSGNR